MTEDLDATSIGSGLTSIGTASWNSIIVINAEEPGETVIVIQQTGNLVLMYEGDDVQKFYIWHRKDGSTTPIVRGLNQIDVVARDEIVYQLIDPSSDKVKFAYNVQEPASTT